MRKSAPRDNRASSLRKADRQIATIGPIFLAALTISALWQLIDWLF